MQYNPGFNVMWEINQNYKPFAGLVTNRIIYLALKSFKHTQQAKRKGYGCINTLMVVPLIVLKGDKVQKMEAALNLKMVLFLFNTMKVYKEKNIKWKWNVELQ